MRSVVIAAAAAVLLAAAAPTVAGAQASQPAAAAAVPQFTKVAPDTRPLQYGRFTVEVRGHGPDVILIPGLSSSRDTWAAVVKANEGRFRFHMIQIAGFAGTPAGDNAQGEVVAPTVEAIDRYIKDKGLKSPAVIGHSLGGEAALMLAARHPGDVGKAMAVDSLPFLGVLMGGPAATPDQVRPMAEKGAEAMAKTDDTSWISRSAANVRPLVTDKARQDEVLGWSVASDRSVVGRAFRDLMVTDLRPELGKITAPTTIVYAHGPQYPQTADQTDAFIRLLYGDLKGVKLVRVEPSRHFIMFDQPQRFEAEVETFLAK